MNALLYLSPGLTHPASFFDGLEGLVWAREIESCQVPVALKLQRSCIACVRAHTEHHPADRCAFFARGPRVRAYLLQAS